MSGIRPIRKQDYSCQHWHNWRWDGWCLSWPPRPCQAQSHRAAGQCELTPGQLPASLCRSSLDNGWVGNCDKQWWQKVRCILFSSITPTNLGRFSKPGTDLKSAPDIFKTNISAKTWSNCTCRGRFENVMTSRFQMCPWFWKSTKICGIDRAKQNRPPPPLTSLVKSTCQ